MLIFEQTLMLFIFVGIGYGLVKGRALKSEDSGIISRLLVNVILPCVSFRTFATSFSVDYIKSNGTILSASVVILVAVAIAMYFFSKVFSKNKYERCVYEYSLVMPSYGFMGYALAEGCFGASGLLDFMVFSLPATVYIYTVAFSRLTKRSFTVKGLINPPVIATILGIITGLSELRLPGFFIGVIDSASGCMPPLSMIMTGMVIAGYKTREIAGNWKIYPVILLRLVIIPCVIGVITGLSGNLAIMRTAVLFYCLPCGLNTVVFPKLVGEDCGLGAGIALVSTALSLATIPLIFKIFNMG